MGQANRLYLDRAQTNWSCAGSAFISASNAESRVNPQKFGSREDKQASCEFTQCVVRRQRFSKKTQKLGSASNFILFVPFYLTLRLVKPSFIRRSCRPVDGCIIIYLFVGCPSMFNPMDDPALSEERVTASQPFSPALGSDSTTQGRTGA